MSEMLERVMTLKPCPFCGNEAVLLETMYIEPSWWCASVVCTGIHEHTCSVQMVCGGSTKDEALTNAVRAWNRRAE